MSTTVSYKGQTLTTVSNDTKTLLTEGKYLEDDLTLTDVSGSGATLITKNVSANGTYNASSDSADGYSQVNVAVPNTYTNADEGKVVSDGALVAQTSKSINSNGTHSTVTNNQVVVAVPNSYSQSDEGKVVSNGALVAQTSDTVTANDTYDTTLINSLTVNVSGGGGDNTKWLNLVGRTGTSFEDDAVETLGARAFGGWSSLTTLSLPNLISLVGSYAFGDSTNLSSFYFPKLTTISNTNNFNTAGSTTSAIVLPSLATIPNNNVFNSYRGVAIDIGGTLSRFNQYVFQSSTNFNTLILRKSDVVELGNINNFQNTPFASGKAGGTLYVPQSLISSYQSATNWSTILGYSTNSIAAIEGSQYENYYADGTQISA